MRPQNMDDIIVFQTDTVFGIGCSAFDKKSIRKIFKIKGREKSKTLPILVSSKKKISEVAFLSKYEKEIVKSFFPGPLTLVLKPKLKFPKELIADNGTIAVRMPKSKLALSVIRKFGGIMAVTSANLSGKKSAITKKEAEEFANKFNLDFYFSDKEKIKKIPSTILKIEGKKPIILRRGPITKKEILTCLKQL